MKKKKMGLFVCMWQVKGQKNILYVFLLSHSMSKKHGLGRDQRSKKHCLLPGSKVKRTFPSGFKGQKNIFFDFSTFAFYVEKSWS